MGGTGGAAALVGDIGPTDITVDPSGKTMPGRKSDVDELLND